MKLLYGTTNEGKLNGMRSILKPLGIELIGLDEIEGDLPYIPEDGKEPIDNAKQKSDMYYEAFKIPVFSLDSGLYFIDEPDLIQPGTYIRRYTGKEMNDDDLLAHYMEVASSNGGTIKAQYINGISLVIDENTRYEHQGVDISFKPFLLTSEPHEKRIKGFPLNTISKDIDSGEYFYDMEIESKDSKEQKEAFRTFFKKALGI